MHETTKMQLKFVLITFKVILLNKVFAQYDIPSTTEVYNLQVTGSDPIRIYETEPLWDRRPISKPISTTQRMWRDYDHRSIKTKLKTAETRRNDQYFGIEDDDSEDSRPNSSEELKKFLKNYAEQFRRATTKTPIINHEDFDSSERFNKIELITKPSDEPTNRLANLYLEDEEKDILSVGDKSKSWNLLNIKRHKNPLEDKTGWVSMDVVPWSISKIAKWQSNLLKPNTEERPEPVSIKPFSPYIPHGTNYDPKLFNYNFDNINNKQSSKPAYAVPTTTYAQKVYLQQDYDEDVPKPIWNKVNYHLHHINEEKVDNCEQGNGDEIITDGLPPNFPKSHPNYNRRKSSMNDEHPASHPFNGDGEWVLLSTTKGYKAPNGRQRSLDIDVVPFNDATSISTHKSVRLTVLPPLKSSKVNMTTSHGGLLQVESTFQTVDEAQKIASKKEGMKKKPTKRRPIKQLSAHTVNAIGAVTPTITTRNRLSHASSVLAAVGAGMIPATMAMLVPMAMGRRRRRDIPFKRKQPNIKEFRIQLPQYF